MDENRLKELHETFLYPVVRIFSKKAAGSGTTIYCEPDPKNEGEYITLVLTNHHVIEDLISQKQDWDSLLKRKIEKEFIEKAKVEYFSYVRMSKVDSSNRYDADVLAYDQYHDLAILRVDSPVKREYVAKIIPESEIKNIRLFMDVVVSGCSLAHEPFCNFGQVTFLNEIIDQKEYIMTNANSIFGNCLPGNTLVSMADGRVKEIKDTQRGDMVWSMKMDGTVVKHPVEDVIESGVKKILKIRTAGREIRCSGNHPLLKLKSVKDYRNKLINYMVWTEAKDLKEGDVIAILNNVPANERVKGFYLSKEIGQDFDRHAFMELVGYYLGDGWIRYDKNIGRYEFSLALYNNMLREKYINTVRKLSRKEGSFREMSEKGGSFTVYSKELCDLFLEKMQLGTGAYEKDIPDWIMTLPEDLKLAFINGYLEADGYTNKTGAWVFEAVNKNIIRKLRMMCIHLGMNVSNLFQRTRKLPTHIAGHALDKKETTTYSFQAYPYLTDAVFNVKNGSRENLPLGGNVSLRKISSIEEDGEEKTYDLKIQGTHNFFADGVLVHNSGGALFLKDSGWLIGVPSRITGIQLGFGFDVTSWMGFAAHPKRIYEFLKEQELHFIFDPEDDYYSAMERRKNKEKESLMALKAEFLRQEATKESRSGGSILDSD